MATDIGELRGRMTLQAQEFSRGLRDAKTELSQMSTSAQSTNRTMRSLQNTTEKMKNAAENGIVPASKLAKNLENDLTNAKNASGRTTKAIKDVGSAADNMAVTTNRSTLLVSDGFEDMLTSIQMVSAAIGAAMVAGVGLSVKTAADFEAQMSRVKAISGATGEEFEALQAKALELGASTSKSASEIAIGFEDMAAMGFNATQIIDAMPGVIAAAEASGSDLAKTSGIVAAALNAFQMEASDATKVADILAMTANISAAGIDDMGYALKYVGPVANALGISLEEVSAAIGIMTNAGLDGSNAGTAMRAALLALNNPAKEQEKLMKSLGFSIKDSSGNAKSLSEIFGDLTESTKDMTQAEKVATVAKLVGTEASAGMIAVMEGGQAKLDEFTKTLQNSGGASKETAAVMKDNLKGAVDELMGAFETAGIKVGDEFIPMLTDIVKKGAEVIGAIGEMDLSVVKTGLAFAGTATAIILLISSIGKLALATTALLGTMGPGGWLIAGLSILGGLLVAAKMKQNELNEVNLESVNALQQQSESLSKNIEEYEKLEGKSKLSNEELLRFLDINSEISKTADPTAIAKLKEEQDKLREKSGLSNKELDRMLQLNGEILEVVPQSNTVLSDQGKVLMINTDKAKEFNAQQIEMIRLELEAQKAKAEANMQEYLSKENQLIEKQNAEKEKSIRLEEDIKDQVRKIAEMRMELSAKSSTMTAFEIEQEEILIWQEQKKLQEMKEQRDTIAENIFKRQGEIQKVQEQIGKLDEVKRKMVDIEIQQAGINAKRGEEMRTIDAEIQKLESAKQKLRDKTPIQQRNTKEYQDSVAAIQGQIDKLNITRSRIEEIIGKAAALNRELDKDIYKTVTVTNRTIEEKVSINNRGRYGRPVENYHTGGITGRGQMPTLHVGGLASQFMSAPLHNEVDVRLLRNEMVLTETQQANLMRMIDAGLAENGANSQAMSVNEIVGAINRLERLMEAGFNSPIIMDSREVGRMAEPHITEFQLANESINRAFGR
jgi:TP901 family phage tail tape measure protein